MSEYLYYKVDGRRAKVRADKQAEFESKYPDAKIYYSYQGRDAAVPLSGVEDFKRKYGAENVRYSVFDDFGTKPTNSDSSTPAMRDEKHTLKEERPKNDRTNIFETIGKSVAAAGVSTAKLALDLGRTAWKATIPGMLWGEDLDEVTRDMSNPITRASVKLGETAERLSREADPTGGEKGFVELLKEGKVGMAMQKALGSGLESLPMMLAASTGVGAVAYGAAMAAGNYADETRENPEIAAWKRGANAVGSAALELAVERIGGPLKNVFGKAGKELTEEAAKGILEQVARESKEEIAKRIVKGIGTLGKEGLEEGGEELLTSFGNDALGMSLDWIDGNKDYGIKAQWDQYKEQNPDADKKAFAREKAEEYFDAFLGGALSGMEISGATSAISERAKSKRQAYIDSEMKKAHELGAAMDYRDMYDVYKEVNKDIDNAAATFVNDKGEATISREFIENLTAEDAMTLSQSKDFSKEQKAALAELAWAKAGQEGLNQKIDQRVEDNINAAKARIDKATENGQVISGMVNGRVVYVSGGIAKNGSVHISEDGTDGPVLVIDSVTGEETTVNSKEITSAKSADATEVFNAIENSFRQRAAQDKETAINTMSPKAKIDSIQEYAGKKIMVDLGSGMIEVEVQEVSPKTGEVRIKGKKGDLGGQSIISLGADVIYDSLVRGDDGNPIIVDDGKPIEDEEVAEEETVAPTTEEAATEEVTTIEPEIAEDEDYRDGTYTILIDGKPVPVYVTNQDDQANTLVYEYEDENGNTKRGRTSISGFGEAIRQAVDFTPEAPVVEEPEVTVETPTTEAAPVVDEAAEAPSEIPVTPQTIDWDVLFETDPENYFAEIQNQFGDKAEKRLNAVVASTQKKLDKLNKTTPDTDNELFEIEEQKEKLEAKIEALNGMVVRLTAPAETTESPSIEVTSEQTGTTTETPAKTVAFGANVDIEDRLEFPKKPVIKRPRTIKEMSALDPMNSTELAARELGLKDGGIKLTKESFLHHTGYGTSEVNSLKGLFLSKEKGGMTVEEAGERLMEIDREYNLGLFDQDDPNAGVNAILDALSENRTMGELRSYIARQRQAEAQREADAIYSFEMEQYEKLLDEVHRDEVLSEELKAGKAYAEEEYNELMTILAEEINDYDTGNQGEIDILHETEDIGDLPASDGEAYGGIERSNQVLQETQPVQTSGERDSQRGGTSQEHSGENVGSSVHSGEPSVSEREYAGEVEKYLGEDIPDFTQESVRVPVAPNPVDNPIIEAQKKEKSLATQLKRYDLAPELKQDLAFSAGRKVGDLFATREEYEVYAENATNLGAYNADFEAGVDESFANRSTNPDNDILYRSGDTSNTNTTNDVYEEIKAIKEKALADGTFMKAPNGKPTNLTERQWLQVRTKNFLNWFGDWINDPENASNVVDENGEPRVVYHGSPYGAITEFNRKGHSTSGLREYGTYFSTSRDLAQLYAYARQQAKGDIEKYELEKAKLDAIIFDNETPARVALDAFDVLDKLEESQKPKVYEVFLNIRKPKVFDAEHSNGWDGWHKLKQDVGYDIKSGVEAIEAIAGHNRAARMSETYDGIIAKNMADVHSEATADLMGDIFLVFDETPNNIKSATNNVGTFDVENPDIRYRADENNTKFVEQFEFKQNNEQQELKYSDEFRRLQEESARMSGQLVSEKDGVQQAAIRGLVGGIGRTLQRELDRATSGRGNKLRTVVNDSKGTSFDIIENVDGRLFHDIFEIVRTYLPNGELVDLHDNYDDAICYITSDGLAGFAVDKDGNLISVYSLYGKSKKGFLGSIKDLITEAGATHLDGYNSPKQPLAEIYSKVFGWKVASMMDYNMEYDHDNIAKNHDMPQVAFMVNTEADIQTKHFDKDQYDEAVAYQLEKVEESKADSSLNRTAIQNAAVNYLVGESRLRAIKRAVNEEAAKLGVQVSYVTRADMANGHKYDKGYYNPRTGEVVICIDNASSIADAIQTILHEAVAHKGLRQLMGDKFNEFINRVYESLDSETKAKVDALAESSYKGNKAVAMEEYMATLAESTNFKGTIWDKIKSIFEDIINSLLGRNDIKIGDNELRYILRASYYNMANPRGMDTVRGWAQDQMMRNEYGINETPASKIAKMDAKYIAAVEAGDMETAQRLVNEAAKIAMPHTQMVDENGNPMVMIHNTASGDFTVFDPSRSISPNGAMWFANEKGQELVGGFDRGDRDVRVFLNITNPNREGMDAAGYALEEGYDGVIVEQDGAAVGVVYNPSQIKSADPVTYDDNGNVIPLSERFNPENDDIRYRTGIDPDTVSEETAKEVYDRVVKAGWQEFQRQFQDAMQPVRIAIDAIQQETGNTPIEDYENFLLMHNQSSSRSRVETDIFRRKHFTPIVEWINKMITDILEARGENVKNRKNRAKVYSEIMQYLIAKHGLERNAYYQEHRTRKLDQSEKDKEKKAVADAYGERIRRINEDTNLSEAERELELRKAKDEHDAAIAEINEREVPDVRDYSGLTALFGMDSKKFREAEAEAQRLVDEFESSLGEMPRELWDRINAATNKTLRHSYECGLISRRQYNEIKSMFKYYIPLRGFDETTAEDVYSYARFEGNRFSPAVAKAGGRTSLADDPLAFILSMAESEIAQGNKNRAKQALYHFILNRTITDDEGNEQQNTLMQVEDVWYVQNVDDNGNITYTIAVPDHKSGQTIQEFEEKMRELEAEGKAQKSKKGQPELGMRFQKQRNKSAHYVFLKVNGVDKAIYINGDPKAAEAINGMDKSTTGDLAKTMKRINRFISSTFTNYSLEFTARNYFRDMLYSHINIGIKESDPEYRKKFRQNWRHNNLRTMMNMLKAFKEGELDWRNLTEDEAAFVEFMKNGGQTGYTMLNSVENHKRDLEKSIERMRNGVENGGVKDSAVFKYTLGAIELLNEASELVTRFAAFKTSRDLGRDVVTSINDAKEITVNFNTKGAQDGKGWRGMIARYFGWSKFFFNASVQGVQNIKSMSEANKLKFGSVVGGIVASGFIVPVLTAAISQLLGGDEEEYWNIPEYDRQNNFCLVLGKGMYAKIPLPIGFREVYAIGDMVAAMAFDKKFKRDVEQVGIDMANKIASIVLPINPLESMANDLSILETAAYTLSPSFAQFVIQGMTNKDWKGAQLQKEYTYNENDPQWMKAFESNPYWMRSLSKWCNEHIGTGDYKGWDWSPEKLDNTLSSLLGGIYSLTKKMGRSISMIWNEENRNLSNIPLSGVVLGSGIDDDDRFVTDAFYEQQDFYDERIGFIKRRAEKFGYDLDDVFLKEKGKHHPKMQEIYGNEHFDFMQEWYKGSAELKKYNKKVKDQEKKIAAKEHPTEYDYDKLAKLMDRFATERREFVEDMLELD